MSGRRFCQCQGNPRGAFDLSEALRNFLFTSESVTEGHPDKIADQISDAVLDEVMKQDPKGRVACETLVTTGLAVVPGKLPPRRTWNTTSWCAIRFAAWATTMRRMDTTATPAR